jgi:GT2 family glycosyltransferase
MPAADIVIVNWNSGSMLQECVRSIEMFGDGRVGRVLVVDNGSFDGSENIEASTLDIQLRRLGQNEGFARACNIGAEGCIAPYILFLNPDARLEQGGLGTALDFLDSSEGDDIGICGVRLVGADGQTQRHCTNFTDLSTFVGLTTGLDKLVPGLFTSHFMTTFDHLTSRVVDQVIGAHFLVRAQLFRELSGFDERFFVYYEEVDFALRARKAGWKSYYLSTACAYHFGGGVSQQVKAHRLFYSLRSRILYAFKNFPRTHAWVVLALTLFVEPVSRIGRGALRTSNREVKDTIRGYIMLWKDLRAIMLVALERAPSAKVA